MKKYVIIGNGTAAVGAIEGIRAADSEGLITVVSAENHPSTADPSFPIISRAKPTLSALNTVPTAFMKSRAAPCFTAKGPKKSTCKKQVILSSGKVLDYDSLCVCTGSSPLCRPLRGLTRWKTSADL